MSQAIRIRAQVEGKTVLLRVRMAHEMESGQRKGSDGRLVPAHFIQQCRISLNGRPVLSAYLGTAIAKDPLFTLPLPMAQKGDKLSVSWTDSRGASQVAEGVVS